VDLYPASTLLPGDTLHDVNPREVRILDLATGYCSVVELAELLQKPVLAVAKDLYGLVMAGHVVMKGLRSGKPPKVEAPAKVETPAPEPAKELTPVSTMLGMDPGAVIAPIGSAFREEDTAIVRRQAPPPLAHPQGFPESEEPIPETVGGGFTGGELPVAVMKPPTPVDDPQRMVKLMNFTQRIAQVAKLVLPEAQHEMVDRLQTRATQQIISGDGPEAVKGLALAISRNAVDAGCDADMVRSLNAQLKALFAVK
jgi:hypothetical protein